MVDSARFTFSIRDTFRTEVSLEIRFRLRSKSFCVSDCEWLTDLRLVSFLIGFTSTSAGIFAVDFDRSFCAFRAQEFTFSYYAGSFEASV